MGARTLLWWASTIVVVAGRTINVKLSAPWPTTAMSPIQEVSEFMAEESNQDFWAFVAALRTPETIALLDKAEHEAYAEASHEQLGSLAVDVASGLLSPLQLSALRLTLAVRNFAPMVETHRSLAAVTSDVCGGVRSSSAGTAWVVLRPSGRVVCSPSELAQTAGPVVSAAAEGAKVPGVDHVFGSASAPATGASAPEDATLYGRIGTSSFWSFYDALVAAQEAGTVARCAFRHGTPNRGTTTPTALQGYGVNLDIKNMEYMNIDDGEANKDVNPAEAAGSGGDTSSEDASVSFPEGEEVGGLVFSTLLERTPSAGPALATLRKELLEASASDSGEIKVWKLKDIGLQATASIVADKDPLKRLGAVAQDFPLQARGLTSVKVPKSLRREVENNYHSRALRAGLLGGGSATLLVNGRPVDIGSVTFNMFALLRTIRDESRLLAKLADLHLPLDTAKALLALGSGGSGDDEESGGGGGGPGSGHSSVRLDIVSGAKGAVTFLNNLEKDPQYKKWPKALRQLLFPSWSLHTLSRNLYTCVLVVDPTTSEGLEALTTVEALFTNMYPVRFGVVLTSSKALAEAKAAPSAATPAAATSSALKASSTKDDSAVATAADVAALFEAARAANGASAAFAFLFECATSLEAGYTRSAMVSAFAAAMQKASGTWTSGGFQQQAAEALSSRSGDASHSAMANMTHFAASKGLPVNSYTLNGLLSPNLDLQQGLMSFLGREQQQLGLMLRDGRLSSGSDSSAKKGSKKAVSDGSSESSSNLPAGKAKSVLASLMALPGTVPRYHPLAGTKPADLAFLLPPQDVANQLSYVHPPGRRASAKEVSLLLVDDWSSAAGLNRLAHAASFVRSGGNLSSGSQEVATSEGSGDSSSGSNVSVAAFARLAFVLSPSGAASSVAKGVQAVLNAAAEDPNGAAFAAELATRLLARMTDGASLPLDASLVGDAATAAGLDATVAAAAAAEAAAPSSNDGHSLATSVSSAVAKELTEAQRSSGAGDATSWEAAVVANGRVVWLAGPETFDSGDVALLVGLEQERRASKVANLVNAASWTPQLVGRDDKGESSRGSAEHAEADWRSNAVAVGAAFVGRYTQVPREDVSSMLAQVDTKHSLVSFAPSVEGRGTSEASAAASSNDSDPTAADSGSIGTVSITVVLNPLTEAAQRVAPLLVVLRDQLRLPLQLLLLPDLAISSFPLSKFYRFVASADLGDVTPGATFADLPKKHVLTMRLDVPEAWNVQSSSALQDADNLRCSDDTCGDVRGSDVTTLGYTLKSLLLGGQCFDEVSRSPPNGLQLTLKRVGASPQNDDSVDTLVMQNLGYFQLAAMPGAWELALAEGRGRDLFEIAPSESSSGEAEEEASKGEASSSAAVVSQAVAVSSFYDANTVLRVRKRPGKENFELLEKLNPDGSSASSDDSGLASVDVSASGGLMAKASASIGNMFKNSGGSVASVGKPGGNDTIHVFSLATGHLYERFLKIMMLSVVKRASMPVKFWLLENFLSPSFKDSADAMAREYGFEVGFVSYKWPSWLRQQTSKQRIIWGYKILFLDVLFPLNVSKVIYVDSDQTVRGDLAELWKLDIKGHPYAYTPFCSSRKETLGYQFWRSGYWKDHLRGKPYHISALYVVDLETFRRKAVGDSLRALYDQLSRDPNSLSNLDQDLPNYAQGMIPIFSLPQEWLWCESWCSDGTKAAAKTIDLCNNPMHKEPKLAMAKRVISGPLFPESWVELDEEIRGLEGRQRVGVRGEHASEEASLDMGFGK